MQQHDFAPKSYKWACSLVIYMLALLLPWNCCHVLYWVGSAVLASSKIPWMLLGYHCLQSVYSLSVHAAADCCRAEIWTVASSDLTSLFQIPSSFTEIRCALCVRNN